MPISAYSTTLKGEYDVVQLLTWLNPGSPTKPDPTHASQADRDFITGDVVCPGCGLGRPTVVVAGRSKTNPKRFTSQAHFRFPEHLELCEFETDGSTSSLDDHLVTLNSTNSALTRLIGDWVSKGIELGIFDQQTMREMRQWFLKIRQDHSYRCEVDQDFIAELLKLPYDYLSLAPKFTPAMAKLPNFNPNEFGNQKFIDENQDIYAVLNRDRHALHAMRQNQSIIVARIKQSVGTLIFDPSATEREYKQVRQLAYFIVGQERSFKWPPKLLQDERKVSYSLISAFCALLLFSNSGDINGAIDAYARIRSAGNPADQLAGNIIGLNPFFDHGILSAIAMAHKVKKLRQNGLVVGSRIDQIRKEISSVVFPR
ncbi:hypothetical protein LYZ77_18525 [Xanthomonas hortorum pv. vitians]|uniref:hypothetical protein n=3 Tax=Xanthomonas hortorum TaxID=56454 RepID=UPI0012B75C45|nr:hypothetical protein [Xanthomonas hortorum]MCE4282751.1 hypothetical protein [Xanthomonas hortorum pv. vitians]MCE4286855.1 hypothetical protein [Xanthomonas hortorum pv. vitians]MCE4287971.1 hypothetical protein [Xanthomonas hortorum pv. vitians]MCE4295658.1 hypothetical protein [Xanthomonas hortorum pv. vitians]MDT7854271.1 hypothetical protein [Xanthomonas hortorum pv. vitians]